MGVAGSFKGLEKGCPKKGTELAWSDSKGHSGFPSEIKTRRGRGGR